MVHTIELPPERPLLPDGSKLGGWWHAGDEPGRIVCDLCPRECNLRPGDRGFCFVRENREGQMVLSTYGRSTGFCIDPIEKKPLNQFFPGTSVLSFGTAGCNLGCKFCQNWDISKSREIERLSEVATPEAIAEAARQHGCRSVAFTYNDPVIWAEYAIDAARACHAVGVKTVAVTAGYITPLARGPFYEVMDAANVDLKGFTEHFYQHLTSSHLEPVKETLRWLRHDTDVWFEITNLVIPQENDSLDEIGQMCDWILTAIGPDVPLHFTAFHPDFRLTDRPHTPPETLLAAAEVARTRGLNYVYVGNIHAARYQTTYCPGCRRPLIERDGYTLRSYELTGNCCRYCGTRVEGHYDARPGNWGARRQPVRIASFNRSAAERPDTGNSPAPPSPGTTVMPTTVPTEMANPTVSAPARGELTEEQRCAIVRAASELIVAATCGHKTQPSDPTLGGAANHAVTGAFVSLKRAGKLRSCCGFLGPSTTVLHAITSAARSAARDDVRFPPVSPSELTFLDVEVWLLYAPETVRAQGDARRDVIEIGRHGLQISRGQARGLLLPGVAIDHGLDAERFLEQVCLKAGLLPTAWKEPDTVLQTFEGLAIGGSLADAATNGDGALPRPPITAEQVAALAELCRGNMVALARGATPNYYALGLADGNVQGIGLALMTSEGTPLFSTSRLSLRQPLPLQATLFGLAESLAQNLARGGTGTRRLDDLAVGLVVQYDPAMHVTVAEPDLRGFDPAVRSLVVMERSNVALVYDPQSAAEEILRQAASEGRFSTPGAASVFSLATVANVPRLTVAQFPRAVAGPQVRPAGVAGKFYPGDAAALETLVDEMLGDDIPEKEAWPAAMVPHAGLIYSGRIAAQVLRRLKFPETIIVIGPKHTPLGAEWSVAPHHTWSIPGATIASDPELARQLAEAISGLELDAAAHQEEHAIEVELPFLARLAPKSRVVGIAIGAGNLQRCREFAGGLARVLRNRPDRPLLLISSDMNHFASDAENRRLDELALSAMESLDPARLLETTRRHHISMCGVLPAVMVMETLKLLDGLSRCQRVGYATSADVSGDASRVVGYAGILLS